MLLSQSENEPNLLVWSQKEEVSLSNLCSPILISACG